MALSNAPYKGTSDWYGSEMKIRRYIFETWRKVCHRFNYQEYLTPLVEYAEIYNKSGEDAGDKELARFTDKAGRNLAIRPEMTPSITRLVSKIFKQSPKPLRLFSIANFMRMEKPQRGRNREFWQLNFDLFGEESVGADVEVLSMVIEIMLALQAPAGSFLVQMNNRFLLDALLDDVVKVLPGHKRQVARWLDKYAKVDPREFSAELSNIGLKPAQVDKIVAFMNTTAAQLPSDLPELVESTGWQQVSQLLDMMKSLGYGSYIQFNPTIIRGFDYYDGMVFEVFDQHPENNRAMFGGGRYNGLAAAFGGENIPAVGCAPGDETTRLFLETWNILPTQLNPQSVFIPVLEADSLERYWELARDLRAHQVAVEVSTTPLTISKAVQYADKHSIPHILLMGSQELRNNSVSLKDMQTGAQQEISRPAVADFFADVLLGHVKMPGEIK